MDRQQIAIQNTDVFHRHPADAQQKIGVGLEHRRVDLIVAFNMLLRQQRLTGGDAADQRQAVLFFRQQADTARGAGDDLDRAFTRQRFQVFFRRVWGTEPQALSNLRTRRRHARLADMIPNEIKHLLLPGR